MTTERPVDALLVVNMQNSFCHRDGAVVDELELRPEDPVVDKLRPDAFFGTSLDTLLRSMRVQRPHGNCLVTDDGLDEHDGAGSQDRAQAARSTGGGRPAR